MPVLRFLIDRLLEAVGRGISVDEVREILFRLKCETEILENGYIEVEVNSDRPDMFSLEGIGRAVKGIMGRETGIPSYTTRYSGLEARVKPPPSRPYVAFAAIYGAHLDEPALEELIQFQEKLHATIGRNRRKVAIGIHDLDKLPGRKLEYREVDIEETFHPLDSEKPVRIKEALEATEQGRKYGRIALRGTRHPAILAGDEIISLPPVINSDTTRLEPGTSNLLIDITGTDLKAVLSTLDVLSCNLAEKGAIIGSVVIRGMDKVLMTPVLHKWEMELDAGFASKWLGIRLDAEEAALHLKRMRFDAEPQGSSVRVTIPPYRVDILHPVDLVEDVAMSIGYDNIEPEPLSTMLRPKPLNKWKVVNAVKELLIGLGFQEVHSFMLTNPSILRMFGEGFFELENPVSRELSAIRNLILPQLLVLASENQHVDMPVKVFEIGDVVLKDSSAETLSRSETHVAGLIMSPDAGYENAQAVLYALLRGLGIEPMVSETSHNAFIEGRTARIESKGVSGILGEVHPKILESFGIRYPVAGFEIDITRLTAEKPGRPLL